MVLDLVKQFYRQIFVVHNSVFCQLLCELPLNYYKNMTLILTSEGKKKQLKAHFHLF